MLKQAAAILALLALEALAFRPEALADGGRRFSHGGGPRFAAPRHPHHVRPHAQRHYFHSHSGLRLLIAAPLVLPVVRYVAPPPPPPVYVARSPYVPPGHAEGYWYWCASAGAYYPYVADCPEGWQPQLPR